MKKKGKVQVIQDPDKKMFNFFERIWTSLTIRICWSCGKPLADEARSYNFDHLIPKSVHPELSYEPDNIYICCLTCHSLKEGGFPTDNHKAAIDKAKRLFGLGEEK